MAHAAEKDRALTALLQQTDQLTAELGASVGAASPDTYRRHLGGQRPPHATGGPTCPGGGGGGGGQPGGREKQQDPRLAVSALTRREPWAPGQTPASDPSRPAGECHLNRRGSSVRRRVVGHGRLKLLWWRRLQGGSSSLGSTSSRWTRRAAGADPKERLACVRSDYTLFLLFTLFTRCQTQGRLRPP